MIPIDIPSSFFKDLNRVISKFNWKSKRPKMRADQLPEVNRGLAAPNLKY